MKVFLLLLLIGSGGGDSPSPSPQDYKWLYHQLFWALKEDSLSNSIWGITMVKSSNGTIKLYFYSRDCQIEVNPKLQKNIYDGKIKDKLCVYKCYKSGPNKEDMEKIAVNLRMPRSRGKLRKIVYKNLQRKCALKRVIVNTEDIRAIGNKVQIGISVYTEEGRKLSFSVLKTCFPDLGKDRVFKNEIKSHIRKYTKKYAQKGIFLRNIKFDYREENPEQLRVSGYITAEFAQMKYVTKDIPNSIKSILKCPQKLSESTNCNQGDEKIGIIILEDITSYRKEISKIISANIDSSIIYHWDQDGDTLWIVNVKEVKNPKQISELLKGRVKNLKKYLEKILGVITVEVDGEKVD